MSEVFFYAAEKGMLQPQIEGEGVTILTLLHNFLIEKNIKNLDDLLREVRMLAVFLNNYSREMGVAIFSNEGLKILAANLIGLTTYLVNYNGADSYSFGGVPHLLEKELTKGSSLDIYKSVTNYFSILSVSKSIFGRDFWDDITEFDSDNGISIFTYEEYNELLKYKLLITENQLSLTRQHVDTIDNIWGTNLLIREILVKVHLQYSIRTLFNHFKKFRKLDLSSGKYNVYKLEKEKAFHKHIYSFLAERDYDLVISEMAAGYSRHDIVLYNRKKKLSAVIELKVNDLSSIDADVNQLSHYLDKVSDRASMYIKKPTVGVLATYYIGDDTLSEVDLIQLMPDKEIKKQSDNFYLYIPKEGCPILIALFNGKN